MTIKIENHDNLVIVHVSEVFKGAELEEIKCQVQNHETINVLVLLDADFIGLEDGINWNDGEHDKHIQKRVDKLAFVGDLKWKEKTFLFLLKGLIPVTIEYFPTEHEELARAWLD